MDIKHVQLLLIQPYLHGIPKKLVINSSLIHSISNVLRYKEVVSKLWWELRFLGQEDDIILKFSLTKVSSSKWEFRGRTSNSNKLFVTPIRGGEFTMDKQDIIVIQQA
jgi:hypothetical protein